MWLHQIMILATCFKTPIINLTCPGMEEIILQYSNTACSYKYGEKVVKLMVFHFDTYWGPLDLSPRLRMGMTFLNLVCVF